MSSLTRRIQKRLLNRKVLIISDAGKPVGSRWPFSRRQLFFLTDGTRIFPESKHPTLGPVIAAMSPSRDTAE